MIHFLHGFTGSPSSWDAIRAPLPVATRAHALLGHHPTQLTDRTFSDEIARLSDEIENENENENENGNGNGNVLVGYSMGARLALALLARHPSRFRSAILIGLHPGLPETERAARAATDEKWASLAERDLASFVARWESQPLFSTQVRLDERTRDHQRAARLAHSPSGLALALRRLGLARMPAIDLASIATPVHLVAGSGDVKFVALAEHAASQLPRARVTVVEGAGHNVALERPERISRLIASEVPK